MTDENYKKALHDAMHETEQLLAVRGEIDKRLAQLKATVSVLFGLLELPPKDAEEDVADLADIGISQAIRQVLKEAGVGLAPTEIKTKLSEAGVNLSKYANPGAVIHNTLKRLESQGEVVPVNNPSGFASYALAPRLVSPALDIQALKDSVRDGALAQIAARDSAISKAFEAFKKAHDEQSKRLAEQFKIGVSVFPKGGGGSK